MLVDAHEQHEVLVDEHLLVILLVLVDVNDNDKDDDHDV